MVRQYNIYSLSIICLFCTINNMLVYFCKYIDVKLGIIGQLSICHSM
jgi:hypothetical protein